MIVDIELKDNKNLTEMEDGKKELDEKSRKKIEISDEIFGMVFQKIAKSGAVFLPICQMLKTVPVYEDVLAETDGLHIFYSPDRVIRLYKKKKLSTLARRITHIILHGILGHYDSRASFPFKKNIDAAMDYETERIRALLEGRERQFLRDGTDNMYDGEYFDEEDEDDYDEEQEGIDIWKEKYKSLGFREIYYKEKGNKNGFARTNHQKLKEDEHEVWNRRNVYHFMIELPDISTGVSDGKGDGEGNQKGAGNSRRMLREMAERCQKFWDDIRKNVLGISGVDIEKLKQLVNGDFPGDGWGSGGGGGRDSVRVAKENQNSYRDILEEFFHESEGCKEEEGSIDKILYTYGFDMYGDVALIEPDETKEVKKLNTIAIALDTSGSCSGKILEDFLRETKNILRDVTTDSKFESILFMQCDAKIQDEKWFYEVDELPIGNSMDAFGFGGTDFRPVFSRVEKLIKEKNLKVDCLIYLSDGYGNFPTNPPPYKTFFVLPYQPGVTPGLQKRDEKAEKRYHCGIPYDIIPSWVDVIVLPKS